MNSTDTINLTNSFRQRFKLLAEGCGHLLWPRLCNNCQKAILEINKGLCGECRQQVRVSTSGHHCGRCGLGVSRHAIVNGGCGRCSDLDINFDGIACGGTYDDAFRDMILSMKFKDLPELVEYIGPALKAAFKRSEFHDRIEMLVPVPLHWRRHLMRGFNQAEVLCKSLQADDKTISKDLVRIRYTQHQWSLDHAGRKRNVKDAFAVRKGHGYKDKVVCLVDDIMTSGATLNECVKVLKEAGATEVYVLTAAVGSSYGKVEGERGKG